MIFKQQAGRGVPGWDGKDHSQQSIIITPTTPSPLPLHPRALPLPTNPLTCRPWLAQSQV